MNRILALCVILSVFASCKKSSSGAAPDKYMTVSAGSSWNYQQNNAGVITNYTLTSTNRDSDILGKTYHVFTNSTGSNQYYNVTGNDYFQFDSIKLATVSQSIDRLYLIDDAVVNSNWGQTISFSLTGLPVPIPLTITNTVSEKGISHTVNSIVYTSVIHIKTTLTSSLIPAASLTTNIDSYYAKNYGLIENTTVIGLNYSGFVQNVNTSIKLMSSALL